MRLRAVILAVAVWGFAGSAQAQAAAPAGGSWDVACRDICTMRHKAASVRLGGFSAGLEVQPVGGALVPVVVVRGLPAQAAALAVAGVSVSLRLDKGAWVDLPCGLSLVCAPAEADATGLGAAFPAARTVSLRVAVAVPGAAPLPPVEHSFTAVGTREALARLKADGVETTSAPAAGGLDWLGMARKLMRGGGSGG